MKLCEFVYWSLMPDEQGVASKFQDILQDEVRMSKLFEDFLRNFYRLEQREYRVSGDILGWAVVNAAEEDLVYLPSMRTDITLRSKTSTVVADAKFYAKTLAPGPYGERVRSSHLYQLMTYLQHERIRSGDRYLAGMLIYPDVGRSLRLRYQLLGIPILVCTVDLASEWRTVREELLALLTDHRPDMVT